MAYPNASDAATPAAPRLSKQSRSKISKSTPPRQPFVGRIGRLEVNILDPGLCQGFAELFHSRAFDRSRGQIKQFDFAVEGCRIGERAAADGLDVEGAPAEATAIAAEAAQVGKLFGKNRVTDEQFTGRLQVNTSEP